MTTITIHVPDVDDQKARILEVLEQIRAGRMSGETSDETWWESEEDNPFEYDNSADSSLGGADIFEARKEGVERQLD